MSSEETLLSLYWSLLDQDRGPYTTVLYTEDIVQARAQEVSICPRIEKRDQTHQSKVHFQLSQVVFEAKWSLNHCCKPLMI